MKTFTVEEARQQLGELVDLALQGEPVAIVKDAEMLVLQKPLSVEPIPMAPPGYFADCYDEEYIRESNEFAKHSVTTPPDDLE